MPRRARIDAAGALHHVIGRGIERRKVFRDDGDREEFIKRLGTVLKDTQTFFYAWALIPNHFHLLLRTGRTPITTVMQRLLSGYAGGFNRRHRRIGQIFHNRYKSIFCHEEPYLHISDGCDQGGLPRQLNRLEILQSCRTPDQ